MSRHRNILYNRCAWKRFMFGYAIQIHCPSLTCSWSAVHACYVISTCLPKNITWTYEKQCHNKPMHYSVFPWNTSLSQILIFCLAERHRYSILCICEFPGLWYICFNIANRVNVFLTLWFVHSSAFVYTKYDIWI